MIIAYDLDGVFCPDIPNEYEGKIDHKKRIDLYSDVDNIRKPRALYNNKDSYVLTGRTREEDEATKPWLEKHGINLTLRSNPIPRPEDNRINTVKWKSIFLDHLARKGKGKVYYIESSKEQIKQIKSLIIETKIIKLYHINDNEAIAFLKEASHKK